MKEPPHHIRADWDAEAQVWVATSDTVPGLVAEADTIESLDAKLRVMVPELLEVNGCLTTDEIGEELGALADVAKRSADRACAAIDSAIFFIEASNKRIASMELAAVSAARIVSGRGI